MAQSRDERNRKRRERYAKLKEQGLTRSQARSVKKAVKQDPSIFSAVADVVKGVTEVMEELVKEMEKDAIKLTKAEKKALNEFEFLKFLGLEENKNKSKRQLTKEFRQAGGKIGDRTAGELISKRLGRPYQESKATNIKYYPNGDNPGRKTYFKGDNRYYYIIKYWVVDSNGVSSERHITLSYKSKKNKEQLIDGVYQYIADNAQLGFDKYNLMDIDESKPIVIRYAVDVEK